MELAKALKKYSSPIRLVSRNPVKVNQDDQLFAADVMKTESLKKAVEGSSVVYICVGFAYSYQVWLRDWPPFMRNIIDACIENNSKLVFFDNMYMYDKNHLGAMDEQTPVNPPSKKGRIRAEIAQMLIDASEKRQLKTLIARSADFYGPSIQKTSLLTETVFKPLSKGKRAFWMGSARFKHSFTYTPDAGKATALLGNTDAAYNQIWHLPTASNPFSGAQWVEKIAAELGVKARYQATPKFMVSLLGLFDPVMREFPEMMYQYDRDYIFRSDKFENQFKIKPTPYLDGIREIVDLDYRN